MSTTRKVTIVSTKNNKVKFYETAATTWGELNAEINRDFDLSNLKATENVNKTTLEHVDAVLPEGEFRVFLRPVKTKSGHDFDNMKFGELRATFKDDEEVKKFLTGKVSDSGRNWTQLKTDELRDFLKEYHSKGKSKSATEVVEENVAEEVTEEQVLEHFDGIPLNTLEKFETAIQLLKEVNEEIGDSDLEEDEVDEIQWKIDEFIDDHSSDIISSLETVYDRENPVQTKKSSTPVAKAEPVETAEQKAERERKDAEIADALKEANDFSSGFTN